MSNIYKFAAYLLFISLLCLLASTFMLTETLASSYWEKDIVDLIESVARIHHPESQHPLLETSIENLFRSLNRVSLQLLVLVDSFRINIKEYNLKNIYSYIY